MSFFLLAFTVLKCVDFGVAIIVTTAVLNSAGSSQVDMRVVGALVALKSEGDFSQISLGVERLPKLHVDLPQEEMVAAS